jgi:GTP-binding protein
MLPVVALVGRPNVGKSTLFNVLTGTRDALVADEPGLTRDRKYGFGRIGRLPYIVVDTGGLIEHPGGLESQMAEQTLRAVAEADRVVLVVDAKEGLTPADDLRRSVVAAASRCSSQSARPRQKPPRQVRFHALGLGDPNPGCGTRRGMRRADGCRARGPRAGRGLPAVEEGIRVASSVRPNVGKSTSDQPLAGRRARHREREPGTMRDTVLVPFERDGVRYTLFDTAGVRRRARVEGTVEKFSVIKTLQAIASANVVIALIDAQDTVAEQDASLLGIAAERGRALVIGVNKWDLLPAEQRDHIRAQLEVRLPFVDLPRCTSFPRATAAGGQLVQSVRRLPGSMREIATPELTRTLEAAIEAHQPPLVRGRRIKLRYAHQGGRNPPLIVIHGNQIRHVPEAYRRYLVNVFRKTYHLDGTPVRVEFRSEENPFAGRRNPLTPRQRRKRQRIHRR